MRKQEMSPCRVPCHLCRMGLVGTVVVGAGIAAVGAGAEVVGAVLVEDEPDPNEDYTLAEGAE